MPLRKVAAQDYGFLIQQIFQNSDNGIVISDHHNQIIAVNTAFTEIMGYHSEEILGKGGAFLRSGRHSEEFYAEIWEKVKNQGKWEGELWVRRKSGEVFPEWLSLSAVKDEKGKVLYYLTIFSDITERKATAERIHSLMHDDPLTGLPNRNAFYDSLVWQIRNVMENKQKLALLVISLHRFEDVNDSFGYAVGDLVLQMIAERLKRKVSDHILLSRISGDEFAFAIPGIIHPHAAGEKMEELLAVIKAPLSVENHELALEAYGGVCIYPEDGETAGELIKGAATAMNDVRETKKAYYQYFNNDIQEKVKNRVLLETQLRKGLKKKEFVLYYQPVVSFSSGKILGAEALIRWNREEKMVSPGDFIPVAEQSEIVIPMTEWVIEETCRQMQQWSALGLPPVRLGVNVTFLQFKQKDFLEKLFKLISGIKMNGSQLKIEITEGVIMSDVARSIQILGEMKKQGLFISVDDFGTGYSSLSYLLQLPIDELKIDQSFVRDLEKKSESKEIVKAIISLAKSLKLTVLAEGVETKAQWQFLREHGCDEMQGYYFSRPVSEEVFREMLKKSF